MSYRALIFLILFDEIIEELQILVCGKDSIPLFFPYRLNHNFTKKILLCIKKKIRFPPVEGAAES